MGEPTDKPEGDIFASVDAGGGEEFMAVKPWIGAIAEPASRKLINKHIIFIQTILLIPPHLMLATLLTMCMATDARTQDKTCILMLRAKLST